MKITGFVVLSILLIISRTRGADNAQIVDVEIGQPIDLRAYNGPNVNLVVDAVDISNVTITVQDYSRMAGSSSGYGTTFGPTSTRKQIKKEDRAVLLNLGATKVLFVDALDTPQNYVRIAIVSPQGEK